MARLVVALTLALAAAEQKINGYPCNFNQDECPNDSCCEMQSDYPCCYASGPTGLIEDKGRKCYATDNEGDGKGQCTGNKHDSDAAPRIGAGAALLVLGASVVFAA